MKSEICNIKVEYFSEPIGLDTKFPHYSWEFVCDKDNVYQSKYRIQVISFTDELFWDSGFVESDKTFSVKHSGKPLEPDTEYKVIIESLLGEEHLTGVSRFRTGLMDEFSPQAKWITAKDFANPLFRKTFLLNKQPAIATAYVAARGFYELYINGQRVGDRILAPAMLSPKSFPNTCAADAYDVTSLLTADNNTIGIMLGTGYSISDFSPWGWVYEGEKRAWAALSIKFQDGDHILITSDESWLTHNGPIVSSSIYHGETYDKNLEIEGWSEPYIDTSDWTEATISEIQENVLNTYTAPIKKLSRKECTELIARNDAVTFCDFKENGAGFLCVKVVGKPGAKVTITHSEHINPDGSLNTFTNRNAKATDVYILKGDETEVYEPRFTYHCFRYAEIHIEGEAQLISAEKVTIGAALQNDSDFYCDDAMIKRFYDNAMRSVCSNFMSHPTDCAVRDERTPCLMDTMAYEELCLHSLDMQGYYRHWLNNIYNQFDPNGCFPLWDGDIITLPKLMAEHYGDEDVERLMYPRMKWVVEKSFNTYKENGFVTTFGDWCAPIDNPENDYKKCFHFGGEAGLCAAIYQLRYLCELCEKLGIAEDKKYYSELIEFYLNEFYEKYFDEEKCCFSDGQQTPNLVALGMGVAKPEHREGILAALKKHIREVDEYRHYTGITGTRYLIRVLSQDKEGMEILDRMLHGTEYPSFGRQVLEYDATTLHEQWLNLEGMMSGDHPMFAGIFTDYYRIFAGITGKDNYKEITIAPKLLDSINELRCTFHCVRGKISVNVQRNLDKYLIDAVIPPNCTATLITPDGEKILLGNGKYTTKKERF